MVGAPVLRFPEYWAEAGCLQRELRGDACTLSVEVLKVSGGVVGGSPAAPARGLCRVLVSDGMQHAWLLATPEGGGGRAAEGGGVAGERAAPCARSLAQGELVHLVAHRVGLVDRGVRTEHYLITEVAGIARCGDAARSRSIIGAGRRFVVSRWAVVCVLYTGLRDKLLSRWKLAARVAAVGLDPRSEMARLDGMCVGAGRATGRATGLHEWGESLRDVARWRVAAGLAARSEPLLQARSDATSLHLHVDRLLLIVR